jgi:integrase
MVREVLPVWRHLRVQDLKRRDVRELVERKAQSAPIMANRILSRISAMLTFALEHDWIESNPASRIRKPSEERSRDRVLSRDEVRELWGALHETEAKNADGTPRPRLSQTLNDMLIVMLLTAQRRGEVCTTRWEDVDLLTNWWTIPLESSKNADPHRVPLTPMVKDILERRAKDGDDRLCVFEPSSHLRAGSRDEGGFDSLQWRRVVPVPRARSPPPGGVIHGRGWRA